MVKDINYYRQISGSYDTANRQESQRDAIKSNISVNFSNSIALESVLVNDIPKDVIIQNKPSKNNTYIMKQIIMQPCDSISTGDLITWNDEYWLCIQDDDVHGIYSSGEIRKCKDVLKFYNSSHVLYEIPFLMLNGLLVEKERQLMTISDDIYSVYCRSNSDIGSNYIDLNTRFLLNGEAFKISGIDRISNDGMLEIQLKKDSITVNDNVSLGIADWGLHQITYEIKILNSESATLFYANTTLQLNIQCKADGVVVNNPTVTYTTTNAVVAIVSATGLITCKGTGDCTIQATYFGISDTIAIHGDISTSDTYSVTITPTNSTLKISRSITLEAHAMNNGIEDLIRHFTWTLVNSDGTTNTYATIVANDKTCVLTAGMTSNKYVKVRALLANDPTKYIDKEIKIINLY